MDNTTAMGLAVFWGHESHQTTNGSQLKNTKEKKERKKEIANHILCWKLK